MNCDKSPSVRSVSAESEDDDDSAALDEFHYYDDGDVEIADFDDADCEAAAPPDIPAAEDMSFRMDEGSPNNGVQAGSGDISFGGGELEDVEALSAQIAEPMEVATPVDDAIATTPVKEASKNPASATPVTGMKVSLKGSAVKQPVATAENILSAKDDNSISARISCANFCVMAAADLVRISREKASRVTELLDVTLDDAFALMKEFKWEELALQEAWFSEAQGEDWVREKCGVFKSTAPTLDGSQVVTCKVCYCDEPLKDCVLLDGCPIEHVVCRECFGQYVLTKLNDVGRGAPDARCVMHKCERRIPKAMFLQFLKAPVDRLKFIRFYYDFFFVSANPSTLWCPNPLGGCGRAVLKFAHPRDVHRGGRRGSSIAVESDTVVCDCGYCWCFACQREAHEPAACRQVYDWEVKNCNESENVSWILANTKQCPRCARPIEKNQGCNHMRCSESGGGCGQEFCWLCLTPWAQHGQSTGGWEGCNIYERNTRDDTEEGRKQREGVLGEKVRQKAKHALQKYMFHYERYINHDRAANLAREVIASGKLDDMRKILHDRDDIDVSELGFITSALQQVVECRRVLKWTYVYGYYLIKEDDGPGSDSERDLRRRMAPGVSSDPSNRRRSHGHAAGPAVTSSTTARRDAQDTAARRQLFEFLQKNLEEKTEALHELIEKDLEERFVRSPDDADVVPVAPNSGDPSSSSTIVCDTSMCDVQDSAASSGTDAAAAWPRRPNDEDIDTFKSKFSEFRSYVTNYHHVTEKFLHQILTDIKEESIAF
ncbi:hypothetical protein FOZ61_007126 [Perkinsus olseni]|uniref:RBR-type E3 ubiquitin transferase n=1 Tax=Perkinsus olseni TaxID=32597 RepID=A0A7J6LAN3_PEROL|nr:hypothetical protein FOZ61_007126 [Perkinsus olseni]